MNGTNYNLKTQGCCEEILEEFEKVQLNWPQVHCLAYSNTRCTSENSMKLKLVGVDNMAFFHRAFSLILIIRIIRPAG